MAEKCGSSIIIRFIRSELCEQLLDRNKYVTHNMIFLTHVIILIS